MPESSLLRWTTSRSGTRQCCSSTNSGAPASRRFYKGRAGAAPDRVPGAAGCSPPQAY
jgi:hypothetical protein